MTDIKDRLRNTENYYELLALAKEAADHVEAQEKRIVELESARIAYANESKNPIGSILINSDGEAIHFRSRLRDFFGALISDRLYIHTRDDAMHADKNFPGLAPHRTALVYADQLAPADTIDAERYRFMRKISCFELFPSPDHFGNSPDVFDDYIDAAMKAAK